MPQKRDRSEAFGAYRFAEGLILIFLRRCSKMAVPKRKTSKARRDKRRNNVWKISAPTLVRCSNCGEYKRPHRLCSACGHYDGREVVKVGE